MGKGQIDTGDLTRKYAILMSHDASSNIEYFGKAKVGSVKADAVWQIMKILYDASNNLTDIQFAEGNEDFDNVWDDRAGLSYS